MRRAAPDSGRAIDRAQPPLLSFSGVSRRHHDGISETAVLEEVSFDLHAGATMGVYGERRSGKSTLLRLAAGIDTPDGGHIRFAGRELALCSAGERARLLRGPIALLTSGSSLPTPGETVTDHVAMAAGSSGLSLREARRRALRALERCGARVGCAQESVASLAQTDWARVALARALVREPRLLLVDEPAPMPSLTERDRFCALLRTLARERGMALLVASEDMSVLQGLATLASLSGGELCSTQQEATVVEFPGRRAGVPQSL